MEVQRTIPIVVPDDSDVLATVRAFQTVQQAISYLAFLRLTRDTADRIGVAAPVNEGGGVPRRNREAGVHQNTALSAIALHQACYADVKGLVSSQMTATAIRLVAGAYTSAWRKGHLVRSHFAFRRPLALWLIGDRGRDASLLDNGTLSLWTVAGRKHLPFKVPPPFQPQMDRSLRINSLSITAEPSVVDGANTHDDEGAYAEGTDAGLRGEAKGGPLRAWLTVTVEVSDPAGHSLVGIDRGAVNALVAVDESDRLLFISGREHQARNERTRQVRRRVRCKLAAHKAQNKDTHSVRRLMDRLERKQRNRTRTFAQEAAKDLCRWAPPEAIFVFEDLRLPADQPVRRTQTKGRLTGWFHGVLRRCIEIKAEERGIPVRTVPPAFTSRRCSQCGAQGQRRGHRFLCPVCGHTDHADVNAARNIRNAGDA